MQNNNRLINYYFSKNIKSNKPEVKSRSKKNIYTLTGKEKLRFLHDAALPTTTVIWYRISYKKILKIIPGCTYTQAINLLYKLQKNIT